MYHRHKLLDLICWKIFELSAVQYLLLPDDFLGHMTALVVVLMAVKGIIYCIFRDATRMYVLCQRNTEFYLSHYCKCY
jgi:hypothetical protein